MMVGVQTYGICNNADWSAQLPHFKLQAYGPSADDGLLMWGQAVLPDFENGAQKRPVWWVRS
jgi:hypothetical protein